jgi:hypothetical protein
MIPAERNADNNFGKMPRGEIVEAWFLFRSCDANQRASFHPLENA